MDWIKLKLKTIYPPTDWDADVVCAARVRECVCANMFMAFSLEKSSISCLSGWEKICRTFAHRLFAHTQIRYIIFALKILNANRNSEIGWYCWWKIRVKNEKRTKRIRWEVRISHTRENKRTLYNDSDDSTNVTKNGMPLFVKIPKWA